MAYQLPVAAPLYGPTPSLDTTYARWSAAESTGGGLDTNGNWKSVENNIVLQQYGEKYAYVATAMNGMPALYSPSQRIGNGSFFLPNISLSSISAAVILLLATPSSEIQVPFEFSENVNTTPNTFANYVESNVVEAYADVNGEKVLGQHPQLVSTPMLLASRFYTTPLRIAATLNGEALSVGTSTQTNSSGFGTQNVYVGSRNNSQFFTPGYLSLVHLFKSAPTDEQWFNWLAYYNNVYKISQPVNG